MVYIKLYIIYAILHGIIMYDQIYYQTKQKCITLINDLDLSECDGVLENTSFFKKKFTFFFNHI